MSDPFIGEIKLVAFGYPRRVGRSATVNCSRSTRTRRCSRCSARCTAEMAPPTFALPDLRCHVPMHFGGGHAQGERAGQDFHTVTAQELPMHTHVVSAQSGLASTNLPATNTTLAQSTAANLYGPATNLTPMHPTALDSTGSSQPHENRQPFLTLNFCIALQGIFPSRS